MKKILLQIAIIILPLLVAAGQEERAPASNATVSQSLMRQGPSRSTNSPDALFDLESNFSLGRGGFAGITWLYSEFWVSKWQSDSLFTVNKTTGAITSNFFIAGIDSVRGMTFDGTNVYVTNNSDTIFKIDTLTKSIVSIIVAPLLVRGIAYDSINDRLWVCNFNTDLFEMDMTGNVLNSILQGTHQLTGMFSIAYDPYTSGGPYIWAFDQGTAVPAVDKILVRIPVATGAPDLTYDVSTDVTAGIAGGLTIPGFANSGTHSLVGIIQTSPSRLISYELSDYVPPAYDASADSIYFTPVTTKTPAFLSSPISWQIVTHNRGGNTIDSLGVDLTVNDGATNVFSASGYALGVAVTQQANVSITGSFSPTPTPGTSYSVLAIANTQSQTDTIPSNDSLAYDFSITDTIMATHGPETGGIGLPDSTEGTIGQLFDIQTTCYATSVTFKLRSPELGDSIFGELFDWNGSQPNIQIARTTGYTFTAADVNGVTVTLPFQNGPVQMTPAFYIAGIHQFRMNVTIGVSSINWRPATSWVNFLGSGNWSSSENLLGSPKFAPFVDLNIWSQTMVSVPNLNNTQLSIYPNPASGELNIVNTFNDKCKFTITDIQGKVVYTQMFEGNQKETIRTSEWSNGIYVAKVESDGRQSVSKVIIEN